MKNQWKLVEKPWNPTETFNSSPWKLPSPENPLLPPSLPPQNLPNDPTETTQKPPEPPRKPSLGELPETHSIH